MATFTDDIPDDLRNDPSLKEFKTAADLAKAYKDTKSMVGNSIRPPGPDAGDDAKKAFYTKLTEVAPGLVNVDDPEGQKVAWKRLGLPDDEKGYEAQVPEGMQLDLDAIRKSALGMGLTKAQFKKTVDRIIEQQKAASETTQASQGALRKEWGQAYDQKLIDAANVAAKLGQPQNVIDAIKLGRMDSGALKTWDSIAKAIGPGEGTRLAGAGSPTGKLTPAEATQQISEIMARKDNGVSPYFDATHPEHEALVKKVNLLGEVAYS